MELLESSLACALEAENTCSEQQAKACRTITHNFFVFSVTVDVYIQIIQNVYSTHPYRSRIHSLNTDDTLIIHKAPWEGLRRIQENEIQSLPGGRKMYSRERSPGRCVTRFG